MICRLKQKQTMRHLRLPGVLTLAALLMLAGCDAPGTARLKELCEAEGFPKVYEQVSAAGYYDGRQECNVAIRFFKNWDYEYLECTQTKPKDGFLEGMYHIRKTKSVEECNGALLTIMNSQPYRYEKLLQSGLCFSTEKIAKKGAPYGIYDMEPTVEVLSTLFESTIVGRKIQIRENATGVVIAERKSIVLAPFPNVAFSSFPQLLGCRDVFSEFEEVHSLAKITEYVTPINPRKDNSDEQDRKHIPIGPSR